MDSDEAFQPRLGRIRTRGGRKYLHRALAAANLARGGGSARLGRSGFTGSRIGRGAGVGRVLGRRDSLAAFRQRRVIIKSRVVRLSGKGVASARAHLRYIQRDGTTREGAPGGLYDDTGDCVDGRSFHERGARDRHQFRFIVSPEDGAEYDDLKPLTRRLMQRMEEDLGTKLDWVAVDHHNTGHPHTHIILRGKDERGRDLIIARDYIKHGMRERAAELVDLDLGPRSDRAIELRIRAEVGQERLTSIDRALLRERDGEGLVRMAGRGTFDQTLRMGRLRKLERFGLARPIGGGQWRLSDDLAQRLKRMGERGDIIRTMQRAFAERAREIAAAEVGIYDPAVADGRGLIGRVVERGLSDELNDRHFLIIEGTDGRAHYVNIGRADSVEALGDGAIVRIEPVRARIRESDRTIAAIAAANGGHYDMDAHLRHDPSATEGFAEAHVRRLEAIRRLTGGAERQADGTWIIAPNHLERVEQYERVRQSDRPVTVELLSARPLDELIDAEAVTWLDRELIAREPELLRDAGFGAEAREAQARRRQWLLAQDLATERDCETIYRAGMVDTLRRRELLRIAGQLSDELGLPFVETKPGERIEGMLRRPVEALSGRFALVERSRDFVLVPWRPVLERQIGKAVSGILRGDGVSWTFGRQRGGPTIT